ncbi:MAG: DUF2805 domain-containing protein [Bacteroidota bacterium]
MNALKIKDLSEQDIDRASEMAWDDRTPFEIIQAQFGLSESEIIKLMKRRLKLGHWTIWQKKSRSVSLKRS